MGKYSQYCTIFSFVDVLSRRSVLERGKNEKYSQTGRDICTVACRLHSSELKRLYFFYRNFLPHIVRMDEKYVMRLSVRITDNLRGLWRQVHTYAVCY
jgi:hypothetical protein